MMGSPESEKFRDKDELQHRVRISKAFYLGKYEVTQKEWGAVMNTTPWKGQKDVTLGDDYAAVFIDWWETQDFCRKLSYKEKKKYRLPTEAEWEYACRGGESKAFCFGEDYKELGNYAWCDDNRMNSGEFAVHKVGLKRANRFGVHDMHGNAAEWCSDYFKVNYYANSPQIDPPGPDGAGFKVTRGGDCYSRNDRCRSAARGITNFFTISKTIGFRVVCEESDPQAASKLQKPGEASRVAP